MSKPNVTRVQSATEWTASVHTLHMSKPNVTRVQSVTEWTASEHTLHMSKPNATGFAFLQLLLLSTKHGCSPNKTCASRKNARGWSFVSKNVFLKLGFVVSYYDWINWI